ncbi:MAG: hypothetical protein HC802_23310 [Caldilineaceae bacterium]|nr:hypothetical protein [Caldilineaceae bacterium]
MAYDWATKALILISLAGLMVLGDWRRNWPIAAVPASYWLQIVLFSLLVLPIFWYRTILPGVVPFIVFVGLQAVSIGGRRIRSSVIAALVLLSLLSVAGWGLTDAGRPQEPWKQVGQFLQTGYEPGDLVAFYPPYIQGPSRFYFSALQDEDALAIKLGSDLSTVEQQLTERTTRPAEGDSGQTLFLVVRHDGAVANDDEAYRQLLAYLTRSSLQVSPPHLFDDLSVFHYELGP